LYAEAERLRLLARFFVIFICCCQDICKNEVMLHKQRDQNGMAKLTNSKLLVQFWNFELVITCVLAFDFDAL
jgi:hypothetical protein